MAAPLPRTAISTPASGRLSYQLRDTAIALADLAVAMFTGWNNMKDAERGALVRKTQQLALDLRQLVESSAPNFEPVDFEALSPRFDALSFLTPRERQVLRALAQGTSTTRIAELLGISAATVRSHVKSVMAKLGVHSRVEAVALLLRWPAEHKRPA
jgi:DNA-binding NarL/FixJ family response regulator